MAMYQLNGLRSVKTGYLTESYLTRSSVLFFEYIVCNIFMPQIRIIIFIEMELLA